MRNFVTAILVLGILFTTSITLKSQLTVSTGLTPAQLVQDVLLGSGVTATNVVYTGHIDAIGQFHTGPTPTNLGLTSGLVMSTGKVNGTPALGGPSSGFVSSNNSTPGDPLLNAIVAPRTTNDASVLEFDFFPLSDTIMFKYVFASEEYNNFVNSNFNDVFGFFISGPNPAGGNYVNRNIALIPGTTTPVTINNVNNGHSSACATGPCMNCTYYFDNCVGTSVVFDGFTVVLTAWAVVTPCVNYHIKIAIADVGDSSYDSAVFLEESSFGTNAYNVGILYNIPGGAPVAVEGCSDAIVYVSLTNPANQPFTLNFTVGGTATPGVDYPMLPSSITIPQGQTSANIVISPYWDGIVEGDETVIINFVDACGNTDSLTVIIKDYIDPTVTATGSTSFCESSASQVPLGATTANGYAPFTYTWNQGIGVGQNPIVLPISTTTYIVTSTDVCGVDAVDSVIVNVHPDPTITIVATPPGVCSGYSTSLLASGANTYIWTGGGINTSSNPAIVFPPDSTTYTVFGTSINGCFGQASVTIPVLPSPEIEFIADPLGACVPSIVQFNETSPDSNITNWHWDFGDGNTSNLKDPIHTFTQAGDYTITLTITNSDNCITTLTKNNYISVWPQPIGDLSIVPEYGKTYNPNITFHSNTVSQYWLWDFGDGQTGTNIPPFTHTFPETEGTYNLTLIVFNDFGCSDTIRKDILIIDDVLKLPNIITPNNDGKNDLLVITNAEKYPNNVLIVYNRWGKKVYEQSNYDNTWGGEGLADGTYYYTFRYLDKIHHSSLTIIRDK